jgi:hypothetical protein
MQSWWGFSGFYQMAKDLLDLVKIGYDGQHFHGCAAAGAGHGVGLVDLGDQPRSHSPALGRAERRVGVGYLVIFMRILEPWSASAPVNENRVLSAFA